MVSFLKCRWSWVFSPQACDSKTASDLTADRIDFLAKINEMVGQWHSMRTTYNLLSMSAWLWEFLCLNQVIYSAGYVFFYVITMLRTFNKGTNKTRMCELF